MPARTVSRVLARHRVPRLCAPGPDHRGGDPGLQGHRGALRTRPARRAGAHGRQEDRPDPRRRRLACPRPQHRETTRDRSKTKVGFDYVHSLVDDHSRLAYSEILPDEKGPTCAAFLTRAIAYFAAHGITRIERLMTDNAWAYRWSLRELCASHGIKQMFIKPHCPWQNGKVERLNRTLQTEWAYRQVFTSNDERAAALAPWLEHYNTRRRHSALGGLPRSADCDQPDGRVHLAGRAASASEGYTFSDRATGEFGHLCAVCAADRDPFRKETSCGQDRVELLHLLRRSGRGAPEWHFPYFDDAMGDVVGEGITDRRRS